jgi:hypothetical protein
MTDRGGVAYAAQLRGHMSSPSREPNFPIWRYLRVNKRALIAFAAGSLASLAIVMGPASAASATPSPKYYVSTTASGGNDGSCAHAGYSTVQSAVNAAQTFEAGNPGSVPTIELCNGDTFTEQVTVEASMKFANSPTSDQATILLPAAVGNDQTTGLSSTSCTAGDSGADISLPQSVIEVCQTTDTHITVTINGITTEGQWPANVCYDSLYGILVGGGASLDLVNATVEDIGGSATDGCQGGVGVQVGLAPTNEVGKAVLTNDTVNNYQKNGVTIDGTGSSATITGGTVTGGGSGSQIAQNGIQVSSGATAAISDEDITANQCGITPPTCGPDPWSNTQSTGILLYNEGTPTSVKTSTLTSNDVGIYNIQSSAPATAVTISKNTISSSDEAIGEDSGFSDVTDNSLTNSNIGIWIPQYSGQPISPEITASGNIITGNSMAGVQVESDGTAGDLPVLATVNHSDLSGNTVGVQNNSSSIVTAENDWWGDASGPSGTGIGSGTSADPNVNFFPWSRAVSDSGTTATTSSPVACTKSGTNISSSASPAIMCATGSGRITYSGPGPVLVRGSGSDIVTLGTATQSSTNVSLILNGGSSTVTANDSTSGVYQLWNGATATFSGTGTLTPAMSGLVTG